MQQATPDQPSTPASDEARDQPLYTPSGLCVGALCVIGFLAGLLGGLWLLWQHDATLRTAAAMAWELLAHIGWAYASATY